MDEKHLARLIIQILEERGGEANPVRLACDVVNKTGRKARLPKNYHSAIYLLIQEQVIYHGPNLMEENPHRQAIRLNSRDFIERFKRIYSA